jgi:hypothetical protein
MLRLSQSKRREAEAEAEAEVEDSKRWSQHRKLEGPVAATKQRTGFSKGSFWATAAGLVEDSSRRIWRSGDAARRNSIMACQTWSAHATRAPLDSATLVPALPPEQMSLHGFVDDCAAKTRLQLALSHDSRHHKRQETNLLLLN